MSGGAVDGAAVRERPVSATWQTAGVGVCARYGRAAHTAEVGLHEGDGEDRPCVAKYERG